LAKDAFGILVRNLNKEDAGKLQQALAARGISTEIVPDDLVPAMPQGKVIHRMDVNAQALMLYDPLGRPFTLAWGHVMLIAAGRVRLSDFQRVRKERRVARTDGFGNAHMEVEIDYSTREEQNDHLLLQLILSGSVIRYLVDGEKFNYQYLGDRLQKDVTRNFELLVQDICGCAPHAAVNRGAYYYRENSEEPFAYPSKNAFHEEIAWLLWRMK